MTRENWFTEIAHFSDRGFGIIHFMIAFISFLFFERIVAFGAIGMQRRNLHLILTMLYIRRHSSASKDSIEWFSNAL